MYGIYINDSEYPFTDWILDGYKSMETRDKHTLDRFIGQRVGIIRTGIGKPALVGYVSIINVIDFDGEGFWGACRSEHMIPKGSKYDLVPGSSKCGYGLVLPERCKAIPLEPVKGNRIWREI